MKNTRPAIYVASAFWNKAAVRRATKKLKAKGYTVVSTWTKHRSSPWSSALQQQAITDIDQLREADVLVVLWPGRRGTNSEIGGQLALGRTVIIVGMSAAEKLRNVYYHHPAVWHTATLRGCLWGLDKFYVRRGE